MKIKIFSLLTVFFLVGCVPEDLTNAGNGATPSALDAANPLVALPSAPLGIRGNLSQLSNPPTSASVRLGRWLFFDTRLSADNTISCATCHQSSAALSNTTSVSLGINGQHGTRKAPPILNLAWATRAAFFWDGRAASLEAQASAPIENPIEMGMTETGLVAKLQAIPGYADYFEAAFQTTTVSMSLVTKAIADYEKTRMSGNSPFDQWQAGNLDSYPTSARTGFNLFNQKGCNHCHNGQTFSDFNFHNTGVAWDATSQTFTDLGRSAISGRTADRGAFKTPTVRELTSRAPYMHDGSMATLRDVVIFYNQGGRSNPNLDPAMPPSLNLSPTDIDNLVSFLETLDGQGYQDQGPSAFPQ